MIVMKRSALLLLCSVSSYLAFAQIQKGSVLLGGGVSYTSTTDEFDGSRSSKLSSFKLDPNVGFFILDQLAGGVRINASLLKQITTSSTRKSRDIMIGPFLRCYVLEKSNKLNFFADASYHLGKARYYSESDGLFPGSPSQPQSIINYAKMKGYSVAAGPAYFINKFTSIELSFSYDVKDTDLFGRTKQMMIGLGIQTFL
jgi:hypothetical protein